MTVHVCTAPQTCPRPLYTLQKKKRKTTFKKRNAKPHIGDIGKIILVVKQFLTHMEDTHAIDCR